MKIISWNVNGIVACRRKGLLQFIAKSKADVICLQEIKAKCRLDIPDYLQYWNPSKEKGYSGTLTLVRHAPLSCSFGMKKKKFRDEGRLLVLEYDDYYILNVYAPSLHTYSAPERQDYRLEWDRALREYVRKLKKPVILCGDFNVTRAYIDRYPENQKNMPDAPLFESDVRGEFEKLLNIGLVDVFRARYPKMTGAYTWWGPKNKSRALNHGSRLDYFLVSGSLLPSVQSVKHHTDIAASDHCPISLQLSPPRAETPLEDEDLGILWRSMNWDRLKDELMAMQKTLAQAAFERKWLQADGIARRILNSWCAKALAVREVVNSKSASGVDGVRWKTDIQKAKAVFSLTTKDYHCMPCRYYEFIDVGGKARTANVLTFRDKAMAHLLKFILEPVYESTADQKSFWSRRGRSPLDAHAYLVRDLSGPGSPDYVVVADVMKFYDHVVQEWLLNNIQIPAIIPILREILKSGVIRGEKLCPTERGLSLANPISDILANMMLDGLQSYLFDRLFPKGGVDYLDANVSRFCDDIIITTRSIERGEMILQALTEFLAARGLRVNPKKTYVKIASAGFTYLGRTYRKVGTILTARPSWDYMNRKEQELKELIFEFKGTLRELIEQINWKLRRIGKYHQVTDAFMEFRRLDAVVEGLLVMRMCSKYPRWSREAILNRFWIKDGDDHIFALPSNPSVRIMQLAPTPIVQHKPVRLKYNPFLDEDYYAWLKYKRDAQKANGKYQAVWTRQGGKCAYCGKVMLPDQDIEVVEKDLGGGQGVRNLLYVHHSCLYDTFYASGDEYDEPLDLFSMLDGIMDEAPDADSPYLELREFFRLCSKTPVTLTFRQIEEILGDQLDWQAYFFEAFWYETTPDALSPMWQQEGFPFHMFLPFESQYCIAESWLSQGYKIKAIHLGKGYVVFRREIYHQSGLTIPRRILDRKLPDMAVHEAEKFFDYLLKKYGL